MDGLAVETKRTVFNVTLAKVSGLYVILHPESIKFRNHNVYHVLNMAFALYTYVVSAMMFVNGVNLWTKYEGHRTDAVLSFVIAESYAFSGYKLCVVVNQSDDLLDCSPIGRFDFTSTGRQHTRLLQLWRDRCVKFTNMYAYMGYLLGILYFVCPLWFGDKSSAVTAADGSVSYYRINVMNLYTFFSAETYNAHFSAVFLAEMFFMILFPYFNVIFDTLVAQLCLSLICQLKTINVAFESFGYESITDRRNPSIRSCSVKTTVTKKKIV